MAHPLELAEPNVIDEELTRNCITTVEEMSIAEDRKKEMKTETELHHVKVRIPPHPPASRGCSSYPPKSGDEVQEVDQPERCLGRLLAGGICAHLLRARPAGQDSTSFPGRWMVWSSGQSND